MKIRAAKSSGQGFTLIELLVVIVVISILATISIVAYRGITNRAHSSATALLVRNYTQVLEFMRAREGQYYQTTDEEGKYAESSVSIGHICLGEPESPEDYCGGILRAEGSGCAAIGIPEGILQDARKAYSETFNAKVRERLGSVPPAISYTAENIPEASYSVAENCTLTGGSQGVTYIDAEHIDINVSASGGVGMAIHRGGSTNQEYQSLAYIIQYMILGENSACGLANTLQGSSGGGITECYTYGGNVEINDARE